MHPNEVSEETKNNFYDMLKLIKNKIKSKKMTKEKEDIKTNN